MSLRISYYCSTLFTLGTYWENRDLLVTGQAESADVSQSLFTKKRCVVGTLAFIILSAMHAGFNDTFVGYVISALSIFIGLFANVIVTLYQRFIAIDSAPPPTQPDQNALLQVIKAKNYIRQFTFVTGKNMLIATIIILLSAISLFFKHYFDTDINQYHFVRSSAAINGDSIRLALSSGFIFIFRFVMIYLLIDFVVLLLYSLGSLFVFLKTEYQS